MVFREELEKLCDRLTDKLEQELSDAASHEDVKSGFTKLPTKFNADLQRHEDAINKIAGWLNKHQGVADKVTQLEAWLIANSQFGKTRSIAVPGCPTANATDLERPSLGC